MLLQDLAGQSAYRIIETKKFGVGASFLIVPVQETTQSPDTATRILVLSPQVLAAAARAIQAKS